MKDGLRRQPLHPKKRTFAGMERNLMAPSKRREYLKKRQTFEPPFVFIASYNYYKHKARC
jgi:hypothetical protein